MNDLPNESVVRMSRGSGVGVEKEEQGGLRGRVKEMSDSQNTNRELND